MRVAVTILTVLVLANASAAKAQMAASFESQRMHALQLDYHTYERQTPPDGEEQPYNLRADPSRDARFSGGGLSLGPFKMDVDSAAVGSAIPSRDGRVAHFAHVHLDDVSVLGGNVSGTFDGRSATLRLSWPTGD